MVKGLRFRVQGLGEFSGRGGVLKMGVPFWGVPMMRIIISCGLYIGVPEFLETIILILGGKASGFWRLRFSGLLE